MDRTGDVTAATGAIATVPRGVRWYSIGLCSAALGNGVVLVATGSPLPAIGPVLLLAVAAALCVNRFALFPSEYAATAEAAVLLAAVVGFRADAPYLGPLAIALLVGPLDALHWEQRSFVRMAYNAGSRGLATLATAVTFASVCSFSGSSTTTWVVAVGLSAAAFMAVDVGLAVVLLRLHGERYQVAVSEVLDVDLLTLPIALAGAAAGILATEIGWWATVLALLPAAFVPELVIARARVRVTAMRDVVSLLSVIAVLATVALVTPESGTATLAVLCLFAVVVGIEVAPGVAEPGRDADRALDPGPSAYGGVRGRRGVRGDRRLVGTYWSEHGAATAWAWSEAGVGEAAVAVAMTAAGLRQWRYAAVARRHGLVTTMLLSLLLLGVAVPLTVRGSAWGPVIVDASMFAAGLAARTPARMRRRAQVVASDGVRAR
jgi:hypothetical protein